jgi:ankyrin
MAAREGHLAIVELLLDRGANVDAVVEGDENALIQASGAGQFAVVKLLVARGANVNARVWTDPGPGRPAGAWRTPLGMASNNGHRDLAAFLRASGAME